MKQFLKQLFCVPKYALAEKEDDANYYKCSKCGKEKCVLHTWAYLR